MPVFNTMRISAEPNAAEAERIVSDAISKHMTVLIVGNCSVHYMGRAKSKLESGERILIVKEDGSILVHRPVGYEPVNWQPAGCTIHARRVNEFLEIKAVRNNPPESVRVVFDAFKMVSVFDLVDAGEFSLYATEEDMQKAILLKPSLLEEGFRPASYERRTDPGFIDVYGFDSEGKTVVVEIKRKTAGKTAALQLARYVEAIRNNGNVEVRGILVSPSIAKDVQRILTTLGLEFKTLDPKKCADVLTRSETKKLESFFSAET